MDDYLDDLLTQQGLKKPSQKDPLPSLRDLIHKQEDEKRCPYKPELAPDVRFDIIRDIIREHTEDPTPLLNGPIPERTPTSTIYDIIGLNRILAISTIFYKKVYSGEYAPFDQMFKQRLVPLQVAIEDQAIFFIQWFGGLPEFSEQKGNPAMRLRHSQFRVTAEDRDMWLKYMKETLDVVLKDFPQEKEIIFPKMVSRANYLVNCESNGCRIYGPIPDREHIKKLGELKRGWDREAYEKSSEKMDITKPDEFDGLDLEVV